MKIAAPVSLKWAYSIVLLSAVFPLGLAGSSWVQLATGGSLMGSLPLVGPAVAIALALYRIYLVARAPGTLASYPARGFAGVLRNLGAFALYVGALVAIASLAAGPVMRAFMTHRTDSGAEFFVVGLYLSLLGGLGIFGLICYELSRIVSFEQHPGPSDREVP